MRQKKKITTKSDLQVRMTVLVTLAVLLVSSIVLLTLAQWMQKDYEKLMRDRLSDDILSISRVMEQKLLGVESMTQTMASLAYRSMDGGMSIDSVLCRCLESSKRINGVSLIFDKGTFPQYDGYYERYAYYDKNKGLVLETYINGDELERDSDWLLPFIEGRPTWGDIESDYLSESNEICFFTPLYGKNGKRVGVAYSSILEKDLTHFVTEYKVREDIDISLYKSDGTMVVAPDDYIKELLPEEMIKEECVIDYIGWKVVLSADKNIIYSNVRKTMLIMLLILISMFFVIFLAIRYTVRYVATPFIKKQQEADREKAIMENEMHLAAVAQNELIPHVFPPFPDRREIDISGCLHPARIVGGDLYDYFIDEDNLYFCIGDVSGKGVQASLFMAATHYLFRSATSGMPIADAASKMNVSLCSENEQCRFVTFWMGCLNLKSGKLEYVNAGHDSPILISKEGEREEREEKRVGLTVKTLPASENMPLGVWEEADYVSGSIMLKAGDALLLYTDGVTEAMDADGKAFGKERLFDAVSVIADHCRESDATWSKSLVAGLLEKIRRHSSGTNQSDDITMLCLRMSVQHSAIG